MDLHHEADNKYTGADDNANARWPLSDATMVRTIEMVMIRALLLKTMGGADAAADGALR